MNRAKAIAIVLVIVCITGTLSVFAYISTLQKPKVNLTFVESYGNWNIYQWTNNGSYTAIRNPDPLQWGPIPSGPTINHAYFGIAFIEPFYNGTLLGDSGWKNLAGNLSEAFK